MLSAVNHKQKVNEAIEKELCRGHTAGPFKISPIHDLHCSPIGAVIKKDDSCRLIMDLSQPKGISINENICKDEFHVQYTHFDKATELVYAGGKSCLLSKVDIKHAFRLIPVMPSNWKLLGYFWEGYYFIDVRLPFGLRSSPGIFNRFADLICWVLRTVFKLEALVHYADDFFLVSSKIPHVASNELNCLCNAFKELNIPLAEEKVIGPTKNITYLGIDINSEDLTIAVPNDKYNELMTMFPTWLHKKKCETQELLSL